ncbi:MAG: BREX-6 system BrxE protein [Deltaproteobacteria bacterium]|nr:MAG: BREX-6 system BrxE protein [Deltaproteobacteria bacterium]
MTRTSIPTSTLDHVLTRQLAVAWAGERGEEPRLGWWRTDLVSEFGGQDLFARMMPSTWRWAVFQAVREAARRHDAGLRAQAHDPDRLRSLFFLGPDLDQRLDERLQDLKRAGSDPERVLPDLGEIVTESFSASAFGEWVRLHGEVSVAAEPAGRRIKGQAPQALDLAVDKLVAALDPLGSDYPLPHFREA